MCLCEKGVQARIERRKYFFPVFPPEYQFKLLFLRLANEMISNLFTPFPRTPLKFNKRDIRFCNNHYVN